MEGTLEMWQSVMGFGGWAKKYFILTDSILVCCDKKGGDAEAKVHLKVATIDPKLEQERQFVLYTGLKELRIRAADGNTKAKWVDAL